MLCCSVLEQGLKSVSQLLFQSILHKSVRVDARNHQNNKVSKTLAMEPKTPTSYSGTLPSWFCCPPHDLYIQCTNGRKDLKETKNLKQRKLTLFFLYFFSPPLNACGSEKTVLKQRARLLASDVWQTAEQRCQPFQCRLL